MRTSSASVSGSVSGSGSGSASGSVSGSASGSVSGSGIGYRHPGPQPGAARQRSSVVEEDLDAEFGLVTPADDELDSPAAASDAREPDAEPRTADPPAGHRRTGGVARRRIFIPASTNAAHIYSSESAMDADRPRLVVEYIR